MDAGNDTTDAGDGTDIGNCIVRGNRDLPSSTAGSGLRGSSADLSGGGGLGLGAAPPVEAARASKSSSSSETSVGGLPHGGCRSTPQQPQELRNLQIGGPSSKRRKKNLPASVQAGNDAKAVEDASDAELQRVLELSRQEAATAADADAAQLKRALELSLSDSSASCGTPCAASASLPAIGVDDEVVCVSDSEAV
eukprot:gnl/TRDRNA2_/TRDRNA2_163309_c2_seq2.p2 gnl/TRDRNA2_/TRDRNA2_163309_c2~~gnl/TRDRNA2_/TRDRNA2_163309_c2_seq2.p2  ORF type:complete len:195 (+),score=32.03 gnl/TRDRNA2_/TRDRNA2_163309_c2_seq2:545-1129(+)